MNKNQELSLISIASTLSGTMGKALCYPFDTIKAQLYVQRGKIQIFTFQDIKFIIKSIGPFRNFYKGGLIAIVGSGPAFSVYLTSYHYFKSKLTPTLSNTFLLHLSCGLLAEIVSGILWLPIDVVKERMQVQSKLKCYNYSGSINAIFNIMRDEGLKGLYRGFGATLGFFGPYSALYFMFYEELKSRTNSLSLLKQNLISSSGAFLCASVLTQPLTVSKIRLQVQSVKGVHEENQASQFRYHHQLHGIYKIFKEEGVVALFRGLSMRIVYAGTMTTFNMTSTELIKRYLQQQQY